MKLANLSLILLTILLAFASCGNSKENNTPSSPSTPTLDDIHGKWHLYIFRGPQEASYEFKDNGKGIGTFLDLNEKQEQVLVQKEFTYKFEDDLLQMTYLNEENETETQIMYIQIEEKELISVHSQKGDQGITLALLSRKKNLPEETAYKYYSFIPKTIQGKWDIYIGKELIGKIEFKGDKTYTLSDVSSNELSHISLNGTYNKSWGYVTLNKDQPLTQISSDVFKVNDNCLFLNELTSTPVTLVTEGYDIKKNIGKLQGSMLSFIQQLQGSSFFRPNQ